MAVLLSTPNLFKNGGMPSFLSEPNVMVSLHLVPTVRYLHKGRLITSGRDTLPHLAPLPALPLDRVLFCNCSSRLFCNCSSRPRMSGEMVAASHDRLRPSISLAPSPPSLTGLFPSADVVEAVLFDLDGTLVDSDPLHYSTFRDILQEVGFQGGDPITEEFFSENISGKHNDVVAAALFPDWDERRRQKIMDDKEALFRREAVHNLKPVHGLHKLCKWIENRGLRRAAVTNAPRENAELMISAVGLTDFFELLVIGSECGRAKPFPDPYLKALEHFNIPSSRAFALEDSPSGLKAAVAAGLAVVGVTTRNPGQELIDAGATFLIRDYEDPDLWNALDS